MLEKTVSLYSNDPNLPIAVIQVKAQVKPLLVVSPSTLRLTGLRGENVMGEVEISANLDKPLILKPGAFNLTERINYTLVEVEKGRKYVVRFTSVHPLAEAMHGYLRLQTNYPEKPEVTIFIRCEVVVKNS